jgi:hypothetical protein
VVAYNLITEAIHNNQDLHILVTNKIVGLWFEKMAKKYGENLIKLETVTPKSQFIAHTGIKEVPYEVLNSQILESGLLDLRIPASPEISFEDYLLNIYFGKFLTLSNGLRHVDEIVANYDPEQWQAALDKPLLRNIYKNRIRLLHQHYQEQGNKTDQVLLDWIEESPQRYIQNLFALKVLSKYPQKVGKRFFGEYYSELKNLNLDLRKVPLNIVGNEKLVTEVQLYLEEQTQGDQIDNFHKILDEVSGLLEIEFDVIQKLIGLRPKGLTNRDIKKIKNKFVFLTTSPRINQALSDLDLLLPKVIPSEPDLSWDADKWINWATEEYLPYRFWLENTGQLDDHIAEIANLYSDWFYHNYGKLLFNSDHMTWHALLNLKSKVKSFDGIVLVVIVDNFNTKFYSDFRNEMQRIGFSEKQMQYCFSLIPTCTEVSKKAVITGHYEPFEETGYQNQVEEVWENRLNKKVKYLPNVSELRSVSKPNHDVYFLNFLPLDIVMHQNEDQLGISHSQNVRHYLTMLAQDIQAFASRAGYEQNMMVIITSDHGSTRIPKGTINVIQKKYYQERTKDGHHRYIAITDKELEKLPENIKFDCYIVKKDAYNLKDNYLIARRLYRFLPTDDYAYIHGGLTPEETLVPLAIFQPEKITPKSLDIVLLKPKKIFIGTKVNLSFELTNINNNPCESIWIEFNDSNIQAEDVFIPQLSQLSRIETEVQARCLSTADATSNKLKLKIKFDYLGQPWDFEKALHINITEMVKTKFDLDNL